MPLPNRKNIIVASTNPVKVKAVEVAFQRLFPNQKFKVNGMQTDSGISDQPLSDLETLKGAQNRAENCKNSLETAEYFIGIEGGVEMNGREIASFAWIYIINKNNKIGKARTASFYLPEMVNEYLRQGKELGEANDIVFNKTDSKQKNGAVGLLTNDLMDRQSYYTETLILAMIPFINPNLY